MEDSTGGVAADYEIGEVGFPYFGGIDTPNFSANKQGAAVDDILVRKVPVRRIKLGKAGEERYALIATVFDLTVANYGVARGIPGENAALSYDDDTPYTPAWQEKITGVKRDQIIAVARQFADNADKTKGKSMVIIGAAMNHWYHSDMNYRGIINMLMMCGCIGKSGGGWAHYVGQEKLRPQTGWTALAFALDWVRPPRQMNSTSFFYAHTDRAHGLVAQCAAVADQLLPSGEGRYGAGHGSERLRREVPERRQPEDELRRPGPSRQLAAQYVCLALQPAGLFRQGP